MNAVLRRLHNPHGRECGCDADCWCNRTATGRLIKWWFNGERFGLHHKSTSMQGWQASHPAGDPRQWKRAQEERGRRDSGAET